MTNRRANGTFGFGGGPGRTKGTRNRLAAKVFEDIFAHWCEAEGDRCKGQVALELLYRERPGDYLRLTASVLPKEFVFESTVGELDDDQVDELLMALRQRMVEARAAVPLLPARDEEVVN
jgi:hypothetical protein